VILRRPVAADEEEFLSMVWRSRELHHPYVHPPSNSREFRSFLERVARPNVEAHLVCLGDNGAIAGVFNVSDIVRGPFQSANLGYYVAVPYQGQGIMSEGLRLVLRQVFTRYKLHRLEANVQPNNTASLELVKRNGFRHEGFSPRMLKIGGRWRDHLRFEILAEDWRRSRRR
jgi:ribosomal-protein-alanine N-acetyltransferase